MWSFLLSIIYNLSRFFGVDRIIYVGKNKGCRELVFRNNKVSIRDVNINI